MNSANSFLKGLLRKFTKLASDYRYAQHRLWELRTGADNYALKPAPAPETYAEFLWRTSGLLVHEPTARDREHGALLR
jgi:hypothetical protein